MKDTRTRQEIQDKALHRRTTPGHRKAKPKMKQECDNYNRRPAHDVHGKDEDWSGPCTVTTVKVTAMNRNTTKGTRRMVAITMGTIQAAKVDLQTG
jgi:hypothetical protein